MAEGDEFNIDLRNIAEEVALLRDAFSTIGETIADSINDQLEQTEGLAKRIAKTVSRDVDRAFLNMVKGTDKLLANSIEIQRGSLTQVDIEKQLQGVAEKRLGVVAFIEQARLAGLKIGKKEKEALLNQLDIQERILKKQGEEAKNAEDKLGLTGKLLKGLSKIPILGNLIESEKALSKAQTEAGKATSSRFSTMAAGLKSAGMSLGKNLLDPLVLGGLLVTGIVATFKQLDKLTSGTARNFGISNGAANELNKELTEVAATQDGFFGTTSNLNAAFQEINNRYGTFAKLNGENLKTFNSLTKEAGLSGEAVGELQDTTYLTGNTLKEQTVEYKGQVKILKATTGLALNEKQILEGIKDVSAATKLTLGGSAQAIATAVFKAKALGVEMKDLQNISQSLLNFQSSIEDELSAELLTGKQLNLEGARYAALIGDQAMLAEELAANFGTAADFQSMNVIQQEAMAKSVGLTRDSLAESLMKREAMAKLSRFEGETEKQKYENAVERLGVDEARRQLGNDALADQMESVSLQEKMAAAAQKFQEVLITMAEKVMPAISGFFDFIGNNINGIVTAMKILISLAIAYKAVTLATAVAKIAGASALSGGAAALIAGAAAVGSFALLNNIGDGIFPAGGRAILSPTEGGLIPISSNDDIVVAPRLAQAVAGGSITQAVTGGSNTQAVAGGSTTQAVNSNVNISPSDTKITLTLNGQAIGNANARQAYGVGNSIKALGGGVDYSATV